MRTGCDFPALARPGGGGDALDPKGPRAGCRRSARSIGVVLFLFGKCLAWFGVLGAPALTGAVAAESDPSWLSSGISQSVADLPVGKTRPAGFTATVKIGAMEQVGYVPVEIAVKASVVFPADRRLLVRVAPNPGGHAPPSNGIPVDLPIVIPEGTRSKTFVRFIPKPSIGNAFDVSIREQGSELAGYRAELGQLIRNRSSVFAQNFSREFQTEYALIGGESVDWSDQLPHLRALITTSFGRSGLRATPTTQLPPVTTSQGQPSEVLTFLGSKNLPRDWRGYQLFDAVIVDRSQLVPETSSQWERWTSLRDWVRCGGTVVVTGADHSDWLQASFGASSPDHVQENLRPLAMECEDFLSKWIDQFQRLGQQLNSNSSSPAQRNRNQSGIISSVPFGPEDQSNVDWYSERFKSQYEDRASDWHRAVWRTRIGAGQVIGIDDRESGSGRSILHWLLVERLIDHRRSSTLRRGVDPLLGDERFRRWMIPGVAQPPVYTFMGLLSVFVILVGPVAYRQTTRRGRGYLMFAIAPALALITTLSMFVYGVFADGFGTHARIRQLTWVDGASGDAAERVRGTYFAGIRPGAGLSFPGNAEVFAYRDNRETSWEQLNDRGPGILGRAVITPDTQIFDSSFLPSREQRQFVVHRPRHNVGRLIFQPPGQIETSRSPQVESTFSIDLRDLVIRDHQGAYWLVPDLSAGSKHVRCAPLETKDVASVLGKLYNRQRLFADGLDNRYQRRRFRRGLYDLISKIDSELLSGQQIIDGLFEHWLEEHLQVGGKLPRGGFVATADVGEGAIAVPSAELTESIHYVFGTLP